MKQYNKVRGMNKHLLLGLLMAAASVKAQQKMSPELLWQLGRISAETVSENQKDVLFGVSKYKLEDNKAERRLYSLPLSGGEARLLTEEAFSGYVMRSDKKTGLITYAHKGQIWTMNADGSGKKQLSSFDEPLDNMRLSPDGKYLLYSAEVSSFRILGSERHADLPKSNAYVFDDLNYRHWDAWNNGKTQHVFYARFENGKAMDPVDIMQGEPYDCPQRPFGGMEDFIWTPDAKGIVYVCKKKTGKEYAKSTNTDIYLYHLADRKTVNLSEGIMGYDTNPAFSPSGKLLAWTSMDEDGYESDKNDLLVLDIASGKKYNLTKDWDGTVASWKWSNDGSSVYFLAAVKGTEQVFEISRMSNPAKAGTGNPRQISSGVFDINGIIGQQGNKLVVSRTDMNHAAELYTVDLKTGETAQLSHVNDQIYNNLALSKVEERHIRTSDNKDMLAWVIYPPGFDPGKKYPTLLYCQGGPQSALSQFYSFRWNFQLMAAQGYIVIAPNRRGMPGHGVKWNEAISGDWGGQPIRDYLAAIDDIAKEPYVDKDRLGAVGASYGGFSIYMLAGVHEGRFKSFIAHDGLFDLRSWYGTTEELWFANKDIGGPYWGPDPSPSYKHSNPIELADKWNTPIMIVQGGTDYRVPVEQGLEAFQLAQLKGIKSRLLYLPEENHWVVAMQNGLVWQREFFKWLNETL